MNKRPATEHEQEVFAHTYSINYDFTLEVFEYTYAELRVSDTSSFLVSELAIVLMERDYYVDAIRKHRDYRGDDRCHLDDGELYSVLPEGDTRPERDTAVTLSNCEQFIQCRQSGREYVSPQRRIEELEDEVRRLTTRTQGMVGEGVPGPAIGDPGDGAAGGGG